MTVYIFHILYTQACIECNGDPSNCVEVIPDGPGVPNADMIMYVAAALEDPCGPTSGTIAFAGACYLEDELDRLVSKCMTSSAHLFILEWAQQLI